LFQSSKLAGETEEEARLRYEKFPVPRLRRPSRGSPLHLPRTHHDRAAGAAEDLDSELGLEAAYLLRDRRLSQVQLLGGLGERAVAGDGVDCAQVAKLHEENGGERPARSQRAIACSFDHGRLWIVFGNS